MIWPHIHRWGEWAYEYEEMPDGWAGTYEIRTRYCTRKRCDFMEEVSRSVSSTPVVLRLNYLYRESPCE